MKVVRGSGDHESDQLYRTHDMNMCTAHYSVAPRLPWMCSSTFRAGVELSCTGDDL